MSERHYLLYLHDVSDSASAILQYVQDIDFERFSADRMRTAAVIREFEIIGEAVSKLPEALKAQNSDIPWQDIKDFICPSHSLRVSLPRITPFIAALSVTPINTVPPKVLAKAARVSIVSRSNEDLNSTLSDSPSAKRGPMSSMP